MKIKPEHKKYLISEINFAITKMREEEDPEKKIYFFSAVYAAIQRIFNLNFDPELVFIHLVLSVSYNAYNEFINNVRKGGARTIVIPTDFFDSIINTTTELAKQIENNESTNPSLQKFANLTFLISGNGNYLYQKGVIELPGQE